MSKCYCGKVHKTREEARMAHSPKTVSLTDRQGGARKRGTGEVSIKHREVKRKAPRKPAPVIDQEKSVEINPDSVTVYKLEDAVSASANEVTIKVRGREYKGLVEDDKVAYFLKSGEKRYCGLDKIV